MPKWLQWTNTITSFPHIVMVCRSNLHLYGEYVDIYIYIEKMQISLRAYFPKISFSLVSLFYLHFKFLFRINEYFLPNTIDHVSHWKTKLFIEIEQFHNPLAYIYLDLLFMVLLEHIKCTYFSD